MKRPQIMGILNVTPDSFWPASRAESTQDIARRMNELVSEGADIIDIGAVSTRPGADFVSPGEEWNRLEKALLLLDGKVRVSVDTTRPEIIRETYSLIAGRLGKPYAGTMIVNDISAGEDDPGMLPAVAELGLSYVAMHKRGNPVTMDSLTDYPDGVVEEVVRYFREFSRKAYDAGVMDWILDPGFGFAKTREQNLAILEDIGTFRQFDRPILVGIADKRFTQGKTDELHRKAVEKGADILRVHDVTAALACL